MKAIAFDLDGTIYYGDKIIPGANETIQYARQKGLKVFFLTNNSTKTRRQIHERLLGMGVDCKYEEVYTSGYVATLYAKREKLENVFVFGSNDLKTEFIEAEFTLADEAFAENLLIGFHPNLTYEDISVAMRVAMKAKKIFVCNKEKNYPGKNQILLPGCGAMVAAVEYCSGRHADVVLGKPNTIMMELLCEFNDIAKDEIIMIGDTYESDVAMAKDFGCKSVWIGQGSYLDTICVTTIKDVCKYL